MDTPLSSSSFARKLVRGAAHQLRYPCCFNDFVKDLQEQEGELIKRRNDVDNRVKTSKTEVINVPVVHAWLERESNHLKGNAEELLKEVETGTNRRCCFVLHCPNWIWRYHMAKKLAKKKVEVQECIKEGDIYVKIEDIVSSPDTQNVSSEKSLEFDSRKDAFNQLQKAVKDDKVSMIGLYGMGGCGKTTMAEELKRIAEAENLFNEVHFVTVSNNSKLEVRSIQDKIAKAVQLPLKREEESGKRAKDLCTRLTLEHKRILLILDDVWQELDFGAIGIPSSENHKNFKVLITTRLESVCTLMKCQQKIPLSILTDEEAWTLFQKQAGIFEGTSDSLKDLGIKISNECKGLPVAIAALAGTLKGKAEGDWQDALNRLKNSVPVNINEADLKNPYKCLRVSYDSLDTVEAKSLLLLCSVFPEDTEIPVKFLFRFAIGLGLFGEVQSFEGATDKVSAAKNKLISSCLLSLSYDDDELGECVKMHDLVRDVAIWIASEENKAVKCVLEEDATLECSSVRYLWCKEFPNDLNCSSVEFLCIQTKLKVSDEIFKGMIRLRVLIISWNGDDEFGSLSTMSLKSLTNLRCLFLVSWDLGDISSVGHMMKLESLTLYHCSFSELPDVVVTQLTNLRLLHLSQCDMKRNPFEVIGKHSTLEELYFYYEGSEADSDSGDYEELCKMFIVPQALRRYQINLGSEFPNDDKEFVSGHRSLGLSCFDTSNEALKELAKKAEVLYIAKIKGGGKNIIPDIFQIEGGRVMSYGWIGLWLCDSEDIECLVDTRNLYGEVGSLCSELRKLRIKNMQHLGALYHGVPPNGLFEKLEKLYIENCPVLTCLFKPSMARSLIQLEKLKIVSCDGLKHILAENDLEDEEISRQDHRLVFSKLKKLDIRRCEMLEYIIPITFAQGLEQLESLHIYNCSELKYVFEQRTHGHQIQNELKIELPALKSLELGRNSKMISIFPHYCFTTWPSLSNFYLGNCPEFDIMSVNTFKASSLKNVSTIEKHFLTSEYMVIKSSSKIESIFSLDRADKIGQLVSLRAQHLDLLDLDQMKYICVGLKTSFTFRNLQTLLIMRCEKLEVIFPASVLRSLPELQRLEIRECLELKQIVEEDDMENQKLSNLVCSQPCFPKLFALFVSQCDNLKRLFCVSAYNDLPNLELLTIDGASKLEELIGCEQGHAHEIGNVKVELPTLKLLVLAHLSNLCQGIELPTLTTRVVYDCPKLPLTSSVTTLEEFDEKLELYKDRVSYDLWWKTRHIAREAIISHQDVTSEDAGFEHLEGSIIQKPLGEIEITIEIPQSIEGTDTTTIGEVSTSMKPTLPTFGSELSTSLPLGSIGDKIKESIQEGSIPEETTKATMPADTEGNDGLDVVVATHTQTGTLQCQKMQNVGDSIQEGPNMIVSRVENPDGSVIQKPLGETESTIEIPQSIKRGNEEGATSHNAETVTLSIHSESSSPKPGPSITSQHKSYPHLVDQESTTEPSLLDQRHELGETIVITKFIEDKRKENVQVGSLSKETMKATMLADAEGNNNGLNVLVATHTETGTLQCQKMQNADDSIQDRSNSMDKEGEIGVVSNDSIDIHPDTSSSHSLIIAELGAFKHSADLDDAQVALLAEAIAVYPHLLKVLDKFSKRFQAWMLKTLVDMLFFLRNENAANVTPQREKEFLKLCDEAVQLGFDKSWVDGMRQRVMVRDHRVDHAHAELMELLKMHGQLTQELCKIKNKIDNLQHFVDSQKNCFDFL